MRVVFPVVFVCERVLIEIVHVLVCLVGVGFAHQAGRQHDSHHKTRSPLFCAEPNPRGSLPLDALTHIIPCSLLMRQEGGGT